MNSHLCKKFQELAERTWKKLGLTTRPNINTTLSETSITDDILLELAMLNSPNIDLYKTPQNEECNKGTDWEFWIGRDSEWVRYAIQAKKIDLKTEKYKTLRHKVGGKLQLEILKDYANKNEAVPLYCFYNYVGDSNVTGRMCRHHHCPCPCCFYRGDPSHFPSHFGITITPLRIVESLMDRTEAKNRTFDWIHKRRETRPWSCLVCCDPFRSAHIWNGKQPKIYRSLPKFPKQEKMDAEIKESMSAENSLLFENGEFYNEEAGTPKNIAVINLSPSD